MNKKQRKKAAKKAAQQKPASQLHAELIDLLGTVTDCRSYAWERADLYVDLKTRKREVVVHASTGTEPWEAVVYETGDQSMDVRNGTDEEDVIGAVRTLAAAAEDVVKVQYWEKSRLFLYRVPLDPSAYEATRVVYLPTSVQPEAAEAV